MTTSEPHEGISGEALFWTIAGILVVVMLVIGFVTDWHPLDYRVSFAPDDPLLMTVTPGPTETPWPVPPTETPVPPPTAVVLAPFADDEEHTNYRAAFKTAHKDLTDGVALLDWLVGQYRSRQAGDAEWKNALGHTCSSIEKTAQSWVKGIWPPGPYDASNPLLDAHARLAQAQVGAVLVCTNLGSLAMENAYSFDWPSASNIDMVTTLLGITRTNLDYAMAGFNLDLYGHR